MKKEHISHQETWLEALYRFDNVMKEKNIFETEYRKEKVPYSCVSYNTNVSIKDTSEMQKLLNIPLPEDLKQFYSQYKTISVSRGLRNYFVISPLFYETKLSKEPFSGLLDRISEMGDDLEVDLKETLDPEIHDSLNEKYKVFGWYDPNISGCDVIFWFFDKNGNYGSQEFYHDNWDEWAPKLNQKNLITISSLDELISKAVDQAIKDVEEEEQ
ncbi:MAG: SMI1/KNR4 family protein [Flavobacterium sp.]